MVQYLGVARDVREVLGERSLGRRNRNVGDHGTAVLFEGGGEVVPVVVSECKVREQHRDFLA